MKGIVQSTLSKQDNQCDKATRVHSNIEKYKEFSEERAKKLYEKLLVQYLKKGCNERTHMYNKVKFKTSSCMPAGSSRSVHSAILPRHSK